jgi:hypothetical protein
MFVNSGSVVRDRRVSLSAMVFLGGYLDVRKRSNRGGYLVAHGLLGHDSHSDVASHSQASTESSASVTVRYHWKWSVALRRRQRCEVES